MTASIFDLLLLFLQSWPSFPLLLLLLLFIVDILPLLLLFLYSFVDYLLSKVTHLTLLMCYQSFRDGKVRCLVATDVAARGLDIPEVDLVVQSEPPKVTNRILCIILTLLHITSLPRSVNRYWRRKCLG